jgi:hypothetical protein
VKRTEKRFQITNDDMDQKMAEWGIDYEHEEFGNKLNEYRINKSEVEITEEFRECYANVDIVSGYYPYKNPLYNPKNIEIKYYVASNVKQ